MSACGVLQYATYTHSSETCVIWPSFYYFYVCLAGSAAVGLLHNFRTRQEGRRGSKECQSLVIGAGLERPSFWERWVHFWQADFTPYGYGEANKALFLVTTFYFFISAGVTSNAPFGDSPLAGPDLVEHAPPEFFRWSYPASFVATMAPPPEVLYVWRTALLAAWVACCFFVVYCPRSFLFKTCLIFTAASLLYFYGLMQSFVGQSHRFLAPVWATIGLTISHCTHDDGSWLKKFVLLILVYTYFAGAVAKNLNDAGHWWNGDILAWYFERFAASAQDSQRKVYFGFFLDILLEHRWLLILAAGGAIIFQMLIPIILIPAAASWTLGYKTKLISLRTVGYIVIIGFHGGIYALMGIFYMPQVLCLLLVFDPLPPTTRHRTHGVKLRAIVTTAVLVAMISCMVLRMELWPMSNVPMYSRFHRADPITMQFESHAKFIEEAQAIALAPRQVSVGLGRSIIVTASDENGHSKPFRALSDYADLPSVGIKFKWFDYLTKAASLQMAETLNNGHMPEAHIKSGPLMVLFQHFAPWFKRQLGSCDGNLSFIVEPYFSPACLAKEGRLRLGEVRIPCDATRRSIP